MMRAFATLLMVLLALTVSQPAPAVEPSEMLADPAQESRARDIGKQLRCMVCQNQDIDSSNADLARDLRLLVRERITAGDTNAQVLDYVHERYGDYVLMRPPMNARTWALWFGPALVLLGGGIMVRSWLKGCPSDRQKALSKAEEARIAALMDNDGGAS